MSPGLRTALYVAIGLLLLMAIIAGYRAYILFSEHKSARREASVWASVALALASAEASLGIYTHYRWGWFSGRGGALAIEMVVILLVGWTIWDNTEDEPGWRVFWFAMLVMAVCCFGF